MRGLLAVLAGVVVAGIPGLPLAQTVLSGDHSVDGRLCVGVSCTGSESFPGNALKIKDHTPHILFDEIGNDVGFPENDWKISINDDFDGGAANFAVIDVTGSSEPFRIWGGAPGFSFAIKWDGNIGFGTWLPAKKLHAVGGNNIGLRLEQDGSSGWPPYVWDIGAHEGAFYVRDDTNGTIPLWIESGGIGNALVIEESGEIGLGLLEPTAALHVYRTDGSSQLKVEEASGTQAPRVLLNLQNNGRPEIVMGNTGTGGEWSFGAGTNFILKQGAIGTAPSAKTKLFEISPAGDAILTGSLTTGGTSCGGGCDRVFAEGYDLPTVQEHAAAMFASGYLPNVGPTPEGAAFNLTDKLGRMLNELEHAHVYIAALDTENARLRAELAALRAETAQRLEKLEAASAAE